MRRRPVEPKRLPSLTNVPWVDGVPSLCIVNPLPVKEAIEAEYGITLPDDAVKMLAIMSNPYHSQIGLDFVARSLGDYKRITDRIIVDVGRYNRGWSEADLDSSIIGDIRDQCARNTKSIDVQVCVRGVADRLDFPQRLASDNGWLVMSIADVLDTVEPLKRYRWDDTVRHVREEAIFQTIATVMCRHPEAFSLGAGEPKHCSPSRRASAIAEMVDAALGAGVARKDIDAMIRNIFAN
ncbi:hypothetical protein pmac_cds_519 [Pandoravirus macleodensis]|uniref:Uncharacterized protein n=1 Tax=Pandoravirus macleodensis TaxID=2107707 RepID=A0A2U7UFH3_9VIRU|nr:hypothetical protein pmac_cds_519 [Pandoravirus macleodensis]AVK77207.1 hypothetical protein pmac_cds_519 [Pandoravirus macleodensis]UMO79929.1 hypothetical protein [Pandoravirus aubagnensis]